MTTPLERQDFSKARFVRSRFTNARVRYSDVSGMQMRAVDCDGFEIDSHDLFFGTLTVNGVNVVPLVDAELNRLFPGRELQKAQDPDGLRRGWQAVQGAWQETVDAAAPEHREVQVDDEWSVAQTLRHLILATNAWLGGAIQGQDRPFHEIELIFTGAAEFGFDMSIFRVEDPSWEEILAVRAEHQHQVTDYLDTVTPELLAENRRDPWGGDWQPTVGDCLRTILEEEWAHLRYARRDLATLQ